MSEQHAVSILASSRNARFVIVANNKSQAQASMKRIVRMARNRSENAACDRHDLIGDRDAREGIGIGVVE